MRFDNFLQTLDMGQCKDQIQRQALFDIAMMFVMIDDVIDQSEQAFMEDWLKRLDWDHSVNKSEYYKTIGVKVQEAIDGSVEEDFLAHRASLLTDPWMKSQALKLAEDISNADGELHEREKGALQFMVGLLEDKR